MNANITTLNEMKKKYEEALETSITDVYIDNCKYQYFSTFLYNLETEIAYISYYPRRYITPKKDLTYVVQCISYIANLVEENSHSYESLFEAFMNLESYYDIKCFPELSELIDVFITTNNYPTSEIAS